MPFKCSFTVSIFEPETQRKTYHLLTVFSRYTEKDDVYWRASFYSVEENKLIGWLIQDRGGPDSGGGELAETNQICRKHAKPFPLNKNAHCLAVNIQDPQINCKHTTMCLLLCFSRYWWWYSCWLRYCLFVSFVRLFVGWLIGCVDGLYF